MRVAADSTHHILYYFLRKSGGPHAARGRNNTSAKLPCQKCIIPRKKGRLRIHINGYRRKIRLQFWRLMAEIATNVMHGNLLDERNDVAKVI